MNILWSIRAERSCLRLFASLLLLTALLFPGRQAGAQANVDDVPPAPSITALGETYRLRVENTRYGRVEMSFDAGATYTLVGRVMHPASATVADKTAATPGLVLRGGSEGLAFSVATGRALKLRPAASISTTSGHKANASTLHAPADEPAAIVTNLEPESGLFSDLLPTERSTVRLQSGGQELQPLSDKYTLGENDVFVFSVQVPPPASFAPSPPLPESQRANAWQEAVRKRIETIGAAYTASAVDRARAEKRPVASGTLTLNARLPTDEPDPIMAVTYLIDGDMMSAQNIPPFRYAWDTRSVPDGEYRVEIRALNRNSRIITRALALVVVHNGPAANTHKEHSATTASNQAQ